MVTLNDLRFDELPEHLKALAASAQQRADISVAAGQLARLSHEARTRPPRVYTGRVFGKRAWRGMKVLLPNGLIGQLYRAVRQVATVTWRDELSLRPDQQGVLNIAELRKFRHPAARLIGSLKRGVRERPSPRKVRAARTNGSAPPRPGSRRRGRPGRREVGRGQSFPSAVQLT